MSLRKLVSLLVTCLALLTAVAAPAVASTAAPDRGRQVRARGAHRCANANLVPARRDLRAVRVATLCLINAFRASHRLAPLVWNGHLQRAAQPYAWQMSSQDFFSHVAPSGSTPLARIVRAGYLPRSFASYVYGENLAWGRSSHATPAAIVTIWFHSPEHMRNILDPAFHDTGIGVAPGVPAIIANGLPGSTYVEDFAAVSHR